MCVNDHEVKKTKNVRPSIKRNVISQYWVVTSNPGSRMV